MTSSSVLNTMFGFAASETQAEVRHQERVAENGSWNRKGFGEEQIRSLVRQVFLQTGPRAARQVVFSAVDEKADVGEICSQVGHALSAQSQGNICIVEIGSEPSCESWRSSSSRQKFNSWRNSSSRPSKKVWRMPSEIFLQDEKTLSAAWLRGRLDELRLDFDYTIFQAPPAGQFSDALLLGHLCDGVVLILSANSTRRVAAKRVKEKLYSANARLLGTVLSDRKFPIPDGIYRRL